MYERQNFAPEQAHLSGFHLIGIAGHHAASRQGCAKVVDTSSRSWTITFAFDTRESYRPTSTRRLIGWHGTEPPNKAVDCCLVGSSCQVYFDVEIKCILRRKQNFCTCGHMIAQTLIPRMYNKLQVMTIACYICDGNDASSDDLII